MEVRRGEGFPSSLARAGLTYGRGSCVTRLACQDSVRVPSESSGSEDLALSSRWPMYMKFTTQIGKKYRNTGVVE